MQVKQVNENLPTFSVSEISSAIKRAVEDGFGYVRVRGEVSGLKIAASGHAYMTLKDENAILDAVCWKGTVGKLPFRPEDGVEVLCAGRITTYPGRSKYQMIIEYMEPAGVGALMALLEKRKAQLAAEGLFDPLRKKKLPYLPRTIGVITSPTGAVIRDILHRLADRFPTHVLVWPVLVQGEGAAQQIADAINGFNALPNKPDLLIVARGGGSLEDLWAFNEEIVVRAAAASNIPLISAVGHETDTTLIDYASDVRAPTPTAAAEMAVPVREELRMQVIENILRMNTRIIRVFEHASERVRGLVRGLPEPIRLLAIATQRADDLAERLVHALPRFMHLREQQLQVLAAKLTPHALRQNIERSMREILSLADHMNRAMLRQLQEQGRAVEHISALLGTLDWRKVLSRGFALVKDKSGKIVGSAKAVQANTDYEAMFADGSVTMRKTT